MRYPVSDYYKNHVLDGVTLTRGGGWWTAVLLIEDPVTQNAMINLYSWQSDGEVWKTRKSFTIKRADTLAKLQSALLEFSPRMH